jgi:hypothetical protein
MQRDWLPDFLDQVPTLQLLDPLGALLTGNSDPAPVTYRFADVVKLSGHCCPTVAGAWAMLLTALPRLYGAGETPVRGAIAIEAPGCPEEGALGPFTQVLGYVTGACGDNGFHGLAGRFRRAGLLRFNGRGLPGDPFTFTRTDSGTQVALRYDPAELPDAPALGELLPLALHGAASPEQLAEFGRLWQGRVRALLTDPALRACAVIEA